MFFRLMLALLLLVGPSSLSCAQSVLKDKAISAASLNDGFIFLGTCDEKGNLYRQSNGRGASVMRVEQDGATLVFNAAAPLLQAYTPVSSGLFMLTPRMGESRIEYTAYRFDDSGRILRERPIDVGFTPSHMAVTGSGRTIVLGSKYGGSALEYVGALLDEDGKLLQNFPLRGFSLPENAWHFGQILGSQSGAYFIANSLSGPLVYISDTGDVHTVASFMTPKDETRFHHWRLGNGYVVREYETTQTKLQRPLFFELYQLSTGERSKTMRAADLPGFQTGCFLGDSISVLAHSSCNDREGCSESQKQALPLRVVKLEPAN